MKKILFVATVVKTHIAVFHLPYLKMMKEAGWQVDVAAKNDYENPADCVIPNCDHYYDIAFARAPLKKDNINAYQALKDLIDREQYDIVHCHTPVGGVLARLAARDARKHGTRVIYTAHGFHFFKGAPLKNWLLYYPAEWLCAHWTDTLITINKEDFERAKKHMHAKRVEYIPGVGVDVDKFANAVVDRAEKRREIGVPEDAFLLMSVGELQNRKNHSVVIEALSKLNDPDIYYLIAGKGENREIYEKMIMAHCLDKNIFLPGFRIDIPELWKAADCCVHPSVREGLGMAPLEAMASGLPVISAFINGIRDYTEDGVSGCCVNPRSVDEMCAAIKKMKESPDFRHCCARNNQKTVQRFSVENSNKRMREIYGVEEQYYL